MRSSSAGANQKWRRRNRGKVALFTYAYVLYVFNDLAHLEWHYIYAPISTRDYSFSVCHLVLSNLHPVLNNFQMQGPSFWQHLHTNPRIDLFYQFFRGQSVTKIQKIKYIWTNTHTYTHTVKTTAFAELSLCDKRQRSLRDTRKFFPYAIDLVEAFLSWFRVISQNDCRFLIWFAKKRRTVNWIAANSPESNFVFVECNFSLSSFFCWQIWWNGWWFMKLQPYFR